MELKKKDQNYWVLTSPLADVFGVELTRLIDEGLMGIPLSDYASSMWATALVIVAIVSCTDSTEFEEERALAEDWLQKEADYHMIEDKTGWLRRAKHFLARVAY